MVKNLLTFVAMIAIVGGFYFGGRYVYDQLVEDDSPIATATASPIGNSATPTPADKEPASTVDLPVKFVSEGSGPDQCPGFTANLPQEPFHKDGPTADDPEEGHQAGSVRLADDAVIIFVCLGRQKAEESLQQFVDETVTAGKTDPKLNWNYRKPVSESRENLNDVIRLESEIGARLLTDRYFVQDGWLFVFGLLQPMADEGRHDDVMAAVLDSVKF